MGEREKLSDDIATHYEQLGLSATAARVLGFLVLQPEGTADAPTMVSSLGVAKSSMSVALSQLVRYGLLTKSRPAGARRERYLLADDAFEAVFLSKLPALQLFLTLADRGVDISEPGSETARRMARMRGFYAFMLREFPALLERWRLEAGRQFGQ